MGQHLESSSAPRVGSGSVQVVTFYRFVKILDRTELKLRIQAHAESQGVLGTILLAEEGINGTLAGDADKVQTVVAFLRQIEGLEDLETKESWARELPFYRFRVRLKSEIVTMGLPGVDPNREVGTYVRPENWNDLVDDPRVLLIDARNDYETSIGGFRGAIDPGTQSFRDLPRWLREYEPLKARPPIAMYCTGGIRCEKATAFLKAEGFDEVYHLEGGILQYLEEVPANESRWQGECFVFDQRVAIGPGLELGKHGVCHACRWPVSESEQASELFVQGVSCPRCHGTWSEEQLDNFRNRQRQMEIASANNRKHLGQVFEDRDRELHTPEAVS